MVLVIIGFPILALNYPYLALPSFSPTLWLESSSFFSEKSRTSNYDTIPKSLIDLFWELHLLPFNHNSNFVDVLEKNHHPRTTWVGLISCSHSLDYLIDSFFLGLGHFDLAHYLQLGIGSTHPVHGHTYCVQKTFAIHLLLLYGCYKVNIGRLNDISLIVILTNCPSAHTCLFVHIYNRANRSTDFPQGLFVV